jgi:2-oxoisovalerate dehydrogenase E1 component
MAKAADDYVVETMRICEGEPEPTYASIFEHIRAPFPASVSEAPPRGPADLDLAQRGDPLGDAGDPAQQPHDLALRPGRRQEGRRDGRDQGPVGALPRAGPRRADQRAADRRLRLRVRAAPGATAIPEIQFSDYSLNTLHWLVLLGNQLWQSNGTVNVNVILRLPVEPLHGGSVYHSMCMEGFYAAIPGLTIVAPTTSRDVYGMLRSAAEYTGPVMIFESKGLYRMTLGDAFPGEPTDAKEIAALKRAIGFGGHIPDLPDDFRVPLGKAAVRRAGADLTIVTWGRCTLFCHEAVRRSRRTGSTAS